MVLSNDFEANPNVSPATIHTVARGDWIRRGDPLCLIGDSGTGKSHLLIGLGTAAAEKGFRVKFALAAKLVSEPVEAADDVGCGHGRQRRGTGSSTGTGGRPGGVGRGGPAHLAPSRFRWISHTGEHFDKDSCILANTGGAVRWHGQALDDPEVRVFGSAAMLQTVVTDQTSGLEGAAIEVHRMAMTQVWVRTEDGWVCVGGHAGPRIP